MTRATRANSRIGLADADRRYQPALRVADLTFPADGVIAHRGGPHVFGAENTLGAYEAAIAAGIKMIEAGDLQSLADGTLVPMHDASVDRTTNGAGSVSSFTAGGWRLLSADASTYQASTWPNVTPPFWTDVLNRIGGHCIILPECKDGLDATTLKMCAELKARGLQDSAIIQSFTYSNCQVAAAQGFATMYLVGSIAAVPPTATLTADKIWAIGITHRDTGDLTALATSLHAAKIKAFGYTVDRRADWDALMAKGYDGAFTNDPLYAPGNTTKYKRSTTSHTLNGVHGHGYTRSGDGPFAISTRGDIIGTPGAYRWSQIFNVPKVAGEICPLPSTCTLTFKHVIEALPATNSTGVGAYINAPDDVGVRVGAGPDIASSYLFRQRASGFLTLWKIDAAGAATQVGQTTCNALQGPVTLTAGLTAGVAITTLSVSATVQALKVGHQFLIPGTTTLATLSAAAAIGATSLTVTSITPTATVASGTQLPQVVTVTVVESSTQVIVSRADETSAVAVTITDSAWRGGYVIPYHNLSSGTGVCSLLSIAVT